MKSISTRHWLPRRSRHRLPHAVSTNAVRRGRGGTAKKGGQAGRKKLTCAIVVGIEHREERADHEDVSILVKHFGG